MMMNFMVYGVGMLAYFLIGFPLQMGGAGADREPRRDAGSQFRVRDSSLRERYRPLRQHRLSAHAPRHLRRGGDGDLPVPDGVHGHHDDDRHGHLLRALEVFGVHGVDDVPGRVHVSDLRQLGVGRRLARDARERISAWAMAIPTSQARASFTPSAASPRWRARSSSARASGNSRATASRTPSPGTTSCGC